MMWFVAAMATEPAGPPAVPVLTDDAAAVTSGPPVWEVPVRLQLRVGTDEKGLPLPRASALNNAPIVAPVFLVLALGGLGAVGLAAAGGRIAEIGQSRGGREVFF